MLLLLEPSAAQQKALDALLQAQQTRSNCAYHQWLTPAQFADSFANSAADAAAIAAWLTRQGFAVAPLPAGRGWIEFSGTAAQVEQAFGAPVHSFASASGTRYALEGSITVPAVLVPLIRGLVSLDGALSAPALTTPQAVSTAPAALVAETSLEHAEALTPKLLAPLLQLDAVHATGTTGTGETVAIAARSNVQAADIAAFRSTFGLPAGSVAVSPNGSDPGLTADQAEAELAASWAGAAAPGAHILLVPAATTAATDGADLSLAAIVDQNLAHTVVVDFSACEASLSAAHQAFYAAVYREAVAEGMTVIAASGDSGAAACHAAGNDAAVSTGYAVNGLASTPWNTAVGAAAFAATGGSALAAWSPVNSGDPAYAGGGGRSTVYSLPAWQASIQPQSSGRMLPDVALPTGVDSAFSRGLAFCFSGTATPSGCTVMRSGGASAAAAIFGGIAALAAQQDGPQGNLAPALFGVSVHGGIFTDVQQGAATLACAAGSPDCDASGKIGYAAGSGYDLATGLGSPNVHNLLAALAQPDVVVPYAVTVTAAPSTSTNTQGDLLYNPSTSITFTATITPQTSGLPSSGTLYFENNGTSFYSVGATTSGVGNTTTVSAPAMLASVLGGTNSTDSITAYYQDTASNNSTSSAVTVVVEPSTTTTTVTPATYSPTPNTAFNVTATVSIGTPPAGASNPTGAMTLKLDSGSPQTAAVGTSGGVTSATFSVTVPSSGQHNLQAIYAGDTNYATSTSQSVSVNANSETAGVALSVSPSQSNLTYNPSATLVFTAVVSSQTGGPTPAGTVSFFDQATGQNLGGGAVTLNNGSASVTVNGGLPVNGNSIIAQYTPASGSPYGSANSQALTVNIQPSSTTTTVTPSTTTPTTGTPFAVTVTIAVGAPPAGAANPTGKVTLTLDGTSSQTATVGTAGGVTSATFTQSVPSSGPHNLQAIYAGDANYATSTSSSVAVNASKGATVTTLTANPTTLTPGTPESFTATITAASTSSGSNTFTGTVAFFDGATQLGTAAVTSNAATLSNIALTGTAATHVITAVYSGDGNWAGSSSNAITLKAVLYPVTVSLTANPPVAGPGQVVTLTATVTPTVAPASTVEQNPTGNIVFYVGSTILGTVPLSPAQGNSSTAQLVSSTLPAGQDSLTAVYVGDLFYATDTSSAITVTVQNFALTPSPNNPPEDLDIIKGSTGQVAFTIAGLGGFNNTISVVCSVPPQDDMTCTASPQLVTPSQTVTFTVTTFTTGGPTAQRNAPPLWPPAAGGAALAVLFLFLLPAGKRARILTDRGRRILVLALLLTGLAGTGIGCSSVSGIPGTNVSGTPLGETTLTITAASNIDNTVVSQSAYFTVNVLPVGSTGTWQPVKGGAR